MSPALSRFSSGDTTNGNLGETGPLSQGVLAGREALTIRYRNGMEVRKKRPRGVQEEA
jgi:hypothetical protein